MEERNWCWSFRRPPHTRPKPGSRFDEIVATIQSVPERGGGSVTLLLK
jgi:hypothetical protein